MVKLSPKISLLQLFYKHCIYIGSYSCLNSEQLR
jgi:hypothetical protein